MISLLSFRFPVQELSWTRSAPISVALLWAAMHQHKCENLWPKCSSNVEERPRMVVEHCWVVLLRGRKVMGVWSTLVLRMSKFKRCFTYHHDGVLIFCVFSDVIPSWVTHEEGLKTQKPVWDIISRELETTKPGCMEPLVQGWTSSGWIMDIRKLRAISLVYAWLI